MKIPHFYKAQSRLGMIYLPYKGTTFNIGVENGPDAVLSESVLKKIDSAAHVDAYTFPVLDEKDSAQYQDVLSDSTKIFRDLIESTLKDYEMQVVIGGDHSVAFPSVLSIMNRVDSKNIGYIQFDTHRDICSFRETPSGNFHGIYLRALTDNQFDDGPVKRLVESPMSFSQVFYVGNLDDDPMERPFLQGKTLNNITRKDILDDKSTSIKRLSDFISKFPHIHLSFDIDVFDSTIAPATGTPSPDGLYPDDVFPLLEVFKTIPSFSMDLVEVNPEKIGAEKTVALAQRVLLAILK
ncbi:arginase family protein [Candidatus Gottesmanbacteria bacterium]|nr:arginase family protein [Candidatus Gottesmanbacteria bacterium]